MTAGQFKALVAAFLVLLGTSCESAPSSDTDRGYGDRVFVLKEAHPEARTTNGWLNPKTLQVKVASTKPEPGDMVINGLLVGWRFVPLTDVIGQLQQPPVLPRCVRVWVILEDRSIVMQEGNNPPDRTYLACYMDPETALFYPETSQIIRVAPKPEAEAQPEEEPEEEELDDESEPALEVTDPDKAGSGE